MVVDVAVAVADDGHSDHDHDHDRIGVGTRAGNGIERPPRRAESLRPVRRTSVSVREMVRDLQAALQHKPGFSVPIDGNRWISVEISALPLRTID